MIIAPAPLNRATAVESYSGTKSAKIGEVHGTYRGTRTGDHNEDCLFVASGKGIRPQRLNEAVDAADLAPTVAALAGISGIDVEGKPIVEVCGVAG